MQTRAVETGDPAATYLAARLLERAGRMEKALGWYRRAAVAGDREALEAAVSLLERAGRGDEGTQLVTMGMNPRSDRP